MGSVISKVLPAQHSVSVNISGPASWTEKIKQAPKQPPSVTS